jgi:MATE family multidrug resistance protein
MTIVDIMVLGRYSARDLAAVGFANAFFFAVTVVGMGAVFGIDPLISQAVGAGDPVRARRALWQGVWAAVVVTAILTLPLLAGAGLMAHVGVDPDLIEPARQYLLIRTTGILPLLLFLVVRAYLQAHGITRPMVIAMVVANIVNFGGDILLVFRFDMGAAGAAASTVAASLLELLIVAVAAKVSDFVKWDFREMARALRVGWPVAFQLGAEVGIFALVGVLAARIGTVPLAAHQVVLSLASFTYTMSLGVANAGSVRVGIAVGARSISATRTAGRAAFTGGMAIMCFGALAFALFPRPLARLVTNKPEVIAMAVPLFVIAALFQLSDGLQAVGSGILRGAGDTHYGFIANLIGHWLVGVPVALYLAFSRSMGVVGLWWGLCAGLTTVAVLLLARFERISATDITPVHDR